MADKADLRVSFSVIKYISSFSVSVIESAITCVRIASVIFVPMHLVGRNLQFDSNFCFTRQKISPVEKFTFSTRVYRCGKMLTAEA